MYPPRRIKVSTFHYIEQNVMIMWISIRLFVFISLQIIACHYRSSTTNPSSFVSSTSTMIQSLAVKVLARQAAASVAGSSLRSHASRAFATSGFPPPRLFDYETVTSNLTVTDAIDSVEEAFKALAKGKVDVPMPMHIGIEESSVAGPGDCHIKGGCEYCYIINCIHVTISNIVYEYAST